MFVRMRQLAVDSITEDYLKVLKFSAQVNVLQLKSKGTQSINPEVSDLGNFCQALFYAIKMKYIMIKKMYEMLSF